MKLFAQVRPIQADTNRTNATARPTRWIPAEVWQRQGMTAQVLTLPGGECIFLLTFDSFVQKANLTEII